MREPKDQKPKQPPVERVTPRLDSDASAEDDELLMSLVESAMACPPGERQAFTRSACGSEELFGRVWKYVEREQRMGEFLLDPLYRPSFPEQPFEPDERLEDRFRVLREIARGGMGIVYEAFDEKLERRIAIKCARAGFGRSLPPEVRHASEVSHPNICKIYEIHTAHTSRGNIDFITMEYLEGETLADRLTRAGALSAGPEDKLSRREAMAIGRQITEGLAAAHKTGLVHGDLKSNNVILTGSGASIRAVITDFGLARRAGTGDTENRSSQIGGAPDYMAPELLKGGKPSMATDVYGLGVMLYELMAGRRPFAASLPRERRLRLVPEPAHSAWDKTLQRCLDPLPLRRFANAGEVAEAIAPNRGRLWRVAAAVALVAAASAMAWGYRSATAPQETVRLAVLPVEAGPELTGEAKALFGRLSEKVRALHGTEKMDFSVLRIGPGITTPEAAKQATATHVLTVGLKRKSDRIVVEILLRDLASRTKVRRWEGSYGKEELRYAPVALAGFLTEGLHLRPDEGEAISSAAKQDYDDGLAKLQVSAELDRALELLSRAVQMDPDSALAQAALAEAQMQMYSKTSAPEWIESARESVRQAELRNPDLAPVHLIHGYIALNSSGYDEAVAQYQRAIELQPNSGEAYRRLGNAYSVKGQDDLASEMLSRAVSLASTDYRAWYNRGQNSAHLGQYDSAIASFTKAIELAPAETAPKAELAYAYFGSGRFADAEAAGRVAVSGEPNARALALLGMTLIYERKELEALPYLLESGKLSPKSQTWLYAGVAYRRTQQPKEAASANQTALQLARAELESDPQSGLRRATVAYLCSQVGNLQEAASEVTQAQRLATNDLYTHFMALLTYEALGQREKSLAVLEQSKPSVFDDVNRWPDLADLSQDPRFLQLAASRK